MRDIPRDPWTPWSDATPSRPGWFNASRERNPETVRYWSGCAWSASWPASERQPGSAETAPPDALPTSGMEWRDFTPAWREWLRTEG